MRALGLAALLLLPLAGCLDSPAPPLQPRADIALDRDACTPASCATLEGLLETTDLPTGLGECPVVERRSVAQPAPGVHLLLIEGCFMFNVGVTVGDVFDRDVGDDVNVSVDVPAGARGLVAQLHVHGAEPVRARLLAPNATTMAQGEHRGDRDHDSFVRFELPEPEEGPWRLRGSLDDLAARRAWTVAFVVYA